MEEYGYTQEAISQALGKSRPAVANAVRLLKLPPKARAMVESAKLTAGHARAILSVEREQDREAFAEAIAERGLSVREAERAAASQEALDALLRPGEAAAAAPAKPSGKSTQATGDGGARDAALQRIVDSLKRRYDTNVSINPKGRAGRIIFEYYSEEELERLLASFGVMEQP